MPCQPVDCHHEAAESTDVFGRQRDKQRKCSGDISPRENESGEEKGLGDHASRLANLFAHKRSSLTPAESKENSREEDKIPDSRPRHHRTNRKMRCGAKTQKRDDSKRNENESGNQG